MNSTTVNRCAACAAVVNVHWLTCLVCQAALKHHDSAPTSKLQPLPSLPSLTEVVREPAMKPDGSPLRPVFWEHHRQIIGPGQPEFFFQDSTGQIGLIIRYKEEIVWVAESMLRSRKAFLEQDAVKEMDIIRESPNDQNESITHDFVM